MHCIDAEVMMHRSPGNEVVIRCVDPEAFIRCIGAEVMMHR